MASLSLQHVYKKYPGGVVAVSDLVLYYVDSRVGIPAGDSCRHCGNCCAPDAQPMHKAAVCGACRWAVDRRGSVRTGRKDVPAGCVPVCVSVYKHEALGNRCAEQKTADGGANPRAVPAESGEQAE